MNEVFKKECEELGIPFEEFPYDFQPNSEFNPTWIIAAMMWILKKRQDKMMGLKLVKFDEHGEVG